MFTFRLVRRAISEDLLASEILLPSVGLEVSGVFALSMAVVLLASSFFPASDDLGASVAFGCGCLLGSGVLPGLETGTGADTGAVVEAEAEEEEEEEVILEIIVDGVTGPTILVSLAARDVRVDAVALSCRGCEMMKEVVLEAVVERERGTVGRESLSMTGGILDVRF